MNEAIYILNDEVSVPQAKYLSDLSLYLSLPVVQSKFTQCSGLINIHVSSCRAKC